MSLLAIRSILVFGIIFGKKNIFGEIPSLRFQFNFSYKIFLKEAYQMEFMESAARHVPELLRFQVVHPLHV